VLNTITKFLTVSTTSALGEPAMSAKAAVVETCRISPDVVLPQAIVASPNWANLHRWAVDRV
jgi:hypothetical protein